MSETFGYSIGAVQSRAHFVITGVEWELDENEVPHGTVFEFLNEEWSAWSVDFHVAAAVLDVKTGMSFSIGEEGQVSAVAGEEAWREFIDPSDNGPSRLRLINGACVVDRDVYVVGARRQAYRRPANSRTWVRADAGTFTGSESQEVVAFNSIDGLSNRELYAVGLGGEIWRRRSAKWSQLDSPTNVRLDVVRQLPSGRVLAGGGVGTLLAGTGQSFELIEHDATDSSITGLAELGGRIYVADEVGQLFELIDDDLVPVKLPSKFADSEGGGDLAAVPDALLYVRNDVVLLFDGKKWTDVTPPDDA